jgi:hypothetical protein
MRRSRLLLAGGSVLYAVSAVLAALHPGAGAWGLDAAGYLSLPLRLALTGLTVAGAAVVAAWCSRAPAGGGPAPATGTEPAPAAAGTPPPTAAPRWRRAATAAALLALYGLVLWTLRSRTQLFGDGMVWLAGVRVGDPPAESEPLSRAVWLGFRAVLRATGLPVTAQTLALLPVLCGVAAAAAAWGIARGVSRGASGRIGAMGLLLTLGSFLLFHGYTESYAPAALLVLLYLLLGLRHSGDGVPGTAAAVCLGLAIPAHYGNAHLLPSLFLMGAAQDRRWARGAFLVGIALLVAAAASLACGAGPREWLNAGSIGLAGAGGGHEGGRPAAPYPALSFAHALDLANAVAFVLPVPALLAVAWAARPRPGLAARDPRAIFLGAAGTTALLAAAAVVLPLPAAQDWDVLSLLLLPAGVLGVRAGARLLEAHGSAPLRGGLLAMALAGYLSAALVLSDEAASEARFKRILSPEHGVTLFARAYGHGTLAEHYRDRGRLDSALVYAALSAAEEPANARRWAQVGTLLSAGGLYEESIPYFEEAVRRGPDRAATRNNLGIAYTACRRHAAALEQFRRAVELEPESPAYRVSLALAYLNAAQRDSARATLEYTIGRWPMYAPARERHRTYFGGSAEGP